MTKKRAARPYPRVTVTFRPAPDHGQLQKVAEVVLAAVAKSAPTAVRRAS
ncbi:hypothetical protein FB476_0382 [Ornithinimicrobium humiphilum]|uniref:Uncharacterized protein n=1 Tax=Ornithinimicrobium humiphilum TaxID=125288 RepID=A0A543KKE4_9MICO|nr:hypothetical protein FB476_0382 [Ornithinimicrobium humiphilum]